MLLHQHFPQVFCASRCCALAEVPNSAVLANDLQS